jgi:Zn ribbon nucleic-acid-binding protein
MYNLKCVGGISNKIFSDTLELINQLLPHCDETLPVNTYEVKKFLSDMGLGYEKIPACRNDCMLFWKDNKDLDSCIVCGESKWRVDTHLDEDGEVISSRKKRQVKVLRWSPLIPRLQRLFMSEHIASYMRWHAEGRTKDGILRHPADSEAWRSFNILYPDFMADSRNVWLGLTSDGFNPFGNMSTSISTWLVMLAPYNLPTWMCMKQTSFILSLVIPGLSSPSMDINVYLQPLIDELLELWNVGVQTFDASKMENFNMRTQLM